MKCEVDIIPIRVTCMKCSKIVDFVFRLKEEPMAYYYALCLDCKTPQMRTNIEETKK